LKNLKGSLMNIFILHRNPQVAAHMHCDKHVVKMCLEYAQLLSTSERLAGKDYEGLYKPTHENHPCAVWVRSHPANFTWTLTLLKHLLDEYTYRYGKVHKSSEVYNAIIDNTDWLPYDNKKIYGWWKQNPPMCMPDDSKHKDEYMVVTSYRQYYLNHKKDMLKYTRREYPDWVPENFRFASSENEGIIKPSSDQDDHETETKGKRHMTNKAAEKVETEKKERAPRSPFTKKKLLASQITMAKSGKNYRKEGTKGHATMKIVQENPGITGQELVDKGGRIEDVIWDLKNENEQAKLTIKEPKPEAA
jgi:hypothetical protein